MTTLAKTAVGAAAAATAGSLATAPKSDWYQSLDTPRWQPPPAAFPMVWTPLYALIAIAAARALDRLHGAERQRFRRAYATNLVLNAAWTAIFFRARQPKLALLEMQALNAANLALLRRAWRADHAAGLALLPYVAWTGFATVLNGAIVARNPRAAAHPRLSRWLAQTPLLRQVAEQIQAAGRPDPELSEVPGKVQRAAT